MDKHTYIRIALKASRGDGDTVNVEIDSDKSVEIYDRYITFKASDGKSYLFTMHNVLYYKIYGEKSISTYASEKLDTGVESVAVENILI